MWVHRGVWTSEMGSLLYFAYGSNMLTERLTARVPSAVPVMTGKVVGRRLDFAKRSMDGSGKADMPLQPGAVVQGVLFQMTQDDLRALDVFEGAGRGYEQQWVKVERMDGTTAEAISYVATDRVPDKNPYDWYLALVIAGARQHGLSSDYLSQLYTTKFGIDDDVDRPLRLEALALLRRVDMLGVLHDLA